MCLYMCVFVQSDRALISICTEIVCSDVLALSLCLQVCLSMCLHLRASECVCVCVQLSQVCVINQLSGQFICWVTSCNFPPDSRPLCQVGITLRAHDKTLPSLLRSPSGFLRLSFSYFPFSLLSALLPDVGASLAMLPCLNISHIFTFISSPSLFLHILSLQVSHILLVYLFFPPMNNIILSPWSKKRRTV